MSPLQFEQQYQDDWQQLENMLAQLRGLKKPVSSKELTEDKGSRTKKSNANISGVQLTRLYRRACEQLALARARLYPAHIVERLEHLTSDAHQVIYQRREFGWSMLRNLIARDFPRAVRRHSNYVWLATALLTIPAIVLGVLVYLKPELVLSVVNAQTAAQFDQMYSNSAEAIGRTHDAETDWTMFGFYIRHNVGLSFQCFAGGLFAGLGSVFFLIFNGVQFGAVAGYLTQRGMADTFYSFVVTHGAFELTAIMLSGAAGLRLGHALVAPGGYTRRQALVLAARESIDIVYGFALMLFIAAAIEAFWSSARWIPYGIKYSVAALAWTSVICYLCLQGRARAERDAD
jgi:uncharacterized membrane protein SpoIIM required for sporulation